MACDLLTASAWEDMHVFKTEQNMDIYIHTYIYIYIYIYILPYRQEGLGTHMKMS